ncbi:hypothetical protein K2173_014206 [Erythroxylum novogranatense]|uniref:G-patch domain-containing protein n=1 Tax=Erythroxylum novogranatense TaxID=1862640 RepID=A0AAV8SDL1_9ROSI|nr:hypothetical protein K2173_014206 [Erythroxylum novogranatense]
MKLSFSIPSKSSKSAPIPKPTSQDEDQIVDKEEEKQYVTEFDPSKVASSKNNRNLVIPPLENEYQPHKRMKNLELPLSLQSDTDLRFEVESLSAADGGSNISYGLNLREGTTAATTTKEDRNGSQNPINENLLLEKLKYDLKRLPEDQGMEEFKDVPVEDFAATLLAGYGWHEGMGIGRNAKGDVKVKEYRKHTDKEGLGFVSHNSNSTGSRKDREEAKQKQKNGIESRDRDKNRDGNRYFVGKDVRIIGGPRDTIVGSKATIVEILDPDRVVLKIAETREDLTLRVHNIADLGSNEEEKCLRKLKNLKISNVGQTYDIDNNSGIERERNEKKFDTDIQRGVSWLRSRIRVRIVSKDLKRGRLYLKKGEIVDVVGPYMCDISMDESKELVQGVDQDLLETALPRRGGPVLVLSGKHKGKYGSLVQRDLDTEIAVVQDAETHELLNVKLEEIAEYMGDPSFIGY